QVGCTVRSALPGYYPAAAYQAEQRLKAGWKQSRCELCLRWRWSDEPCNAAQFKKPPKQGVEYVL
ncbi:MAG: hypothetical protein Q4C67_11275, partial [Deinococcus sp.]|nr:hypothetical protein [Deinococcus sp.]